ncbi:uncharacterized protein PFLUO_LOCUS4511 [Penicillium psychrofluorescens]|uniref:uncharacterized protein n=1 Tax=Penicillium psychrofluorescens TaxID=3158075 RepID=UPI003CCCE1E8
MRYAVILSAGLLGSAMALPAQQDSGDRTPGGPEESPGFMKGANWGSPSESGNAGAAATNTPGWSPSRPADPLGVESNGGNSYIDGVLSKISHFMAKHLPGMVEEEFKEAESVVLNSVASGAPSSSTRRPSPWGSSGLPSTPVSIITPSASPVYTGPEDGKSDQTEQQNGASEGAHRFGTGPKDKREQHVSGPGGNDDYFPMGGYNSAEGQSVPPLPTPTSLMGGGPSPMGTAIASSIEANLAGGAAPFMMGGDGGLLDMPRFTPTPWSGSYLTSTPMPAPTEAPTPSNDVAAEVQSSLSELEASKSAAESAASLSSSYSASAAAWTSEYNIMHAFRRAEETPIAPPPEHLNQFGGYGLGPYMAGAPGEDPDLYPPSRTPSHTPSRTPSSKAWATPSFTSVPMSVVTVTVTPTPAPTEAPTATVNEAAEVQSSLSELEASKSAEESAASLSSSYSASAAAWTSAYNIMHIGRRAEESEPTPEPAAVN